MIFNKKGEGYTMKIGIMGGSFDPVHLGHLDMAEKCQAEFKLDRIMFLPSGEPPHKSNVTYKEIRIKMLDEALKNYPTFYLSRMEADRPGKTYTFDTASELASDGNEYYFIIGGDSLNTLHKWYRAEELFKMMKFIVVDRQHVDENSTLAEKMGAKLYFSVHTGLDISSTEIREKVKNNQSIIGYVTNNVAEIIEKYELYKN